MTTTSLRRRRDGHRRHCGGPRVDGGLVEIGTTTTNRSASTTRARATRCGSSRSAWPNRLVTCGEWMEFIDDGGYRTPSLWLSDGWSTVDREHWTAPLYWQRDGRRLASVHAWVVCARSTPPNPSCTSATSKPTRSLVGPVPGCRPRPNGNTRRRLHGTPDSRQLLVERPAAPRAGERGRRHPTTFGDVWEWTASAYLAYPGFTPERRRRRRVQRQVHERPDGAARWLLRHPGRPRPRVLPQLLLSVAAMDVRRRAPRGAGLTDSRHRVRDRLFPSSTSTSTPRTRRRALAEDVRTGLSATPKELPPKWFYDAQGSALFDKITRLPEYYPTEAERSILAEHAGRDRRALRCRHAGRARRRQRGQDPRAARRAESARLTRAVCAVRRERDRAGRRGQDDRRPLPRARRARRRRRLRPPPRRDTHAVARA